jgi:hypothetical protein
MIKIQIMLCTLKKLWKKQSILALILFGIPFLVPAYGSTTMELNWKDLVPVIEFENPFEKMPQGRLNNLAIVEWIRQMKDAGKQVSDAKEQEAEEAEQTLLKEKVDIDGLLAKKAEVIEIMRKRGASVVPELDGKLVSIPGFVLPIEYEGTKVTEFLLLPWAGACIHTPPPPPNQIVHVFVDEKMARESKGLFEPVTITGTIYTNQKSKSVYLVDGTMDINMGYTMQAKIIEPYKKK